MFAVTFDVDDTLLVIDPALHLDAHRRALRSVGATIPLSLTSDGIIEWDVGMRRRMPDTVRGVAHYLTGSKFPKGFAEQYGRALDDAWADLFAAGATVAATPGVEAVLGGLTAERFRLGLVSGATEAVARRQLMAAGVEAERFTFGGFGVTVERPMIVVEAASNVRRPDVALAHVSGNVVDIRGARAAGVMSIAVASERTGLGEFAMVPSLADSTLAALSPRVVELAVGARDDAERGRLGSGRAR